jgi:membrane dipeptidase
LGGKGDIGNTLDHIDYVAKRFGPEHVGIGMDIGYSCRPAGPPKKMARVASPPRWESFWPPGALDVPQHPSQAWTNWPMITVGLVVRGYSDADIQKIIGGNMLRVARETWKATVNAK